MKGSLIKLLVPTALLMSSNVIIAASYLGASFGSAGLDYDSENKASDGYVLCRIFYGRHINDVIAMEGGLLTGSSVEYDDGDAEEQDEIDLDVFFLNLKASYQLNEKHSVYGKLGANLYQYEISNRDAATIKEEGVGYAHSIGWQYTLNQHLKTGVALQSLGMDELTSGSINFDLMYSF